MVHDDGLYDSFAEDVRARRLRNRLQNQSAMSTENYKKIDRKSLRTTRAADAYHLQSTSKIPGVNLDTINQQNENNKESHRSSHRNVSQSSIEKERKESLEKMTGRLLKASNSPHHISQVNFDKI